MKAIKKIIFCATIAFLCAIFTGCTTRNKSGSSNEAWRNDPLITEIEEAYATKADTLFRQDFLVHFRVSYDVDTLYGLYNPMSKQYLTSYNPFIVKIVDPFLFVSDDGQMWMPMTIDGYWLLHDPVEKAYIINPHRKDYAVLTYVYKTWELRLQDENESLKKCATIPPELLLRVENLEVCDTCSFAF